MEDLSFTTFLKLTLMPTAQSRLSTLHRMHNGDRGYDFYKQMKFAAKGVALGEIKPEEILEKLGSIKNTTERTHNIEMAKSFQSWWDSQHDATALDIRPSQTFKSPTMSYGIRLRPELCYDQHGQRNVVYLWATKAPSITKQAAGVGLYLLRHCLAKDEFSQAKFSILNLRTKTLMSDDLISNQSPVLLQADIAGINELWKSFI